MRTVLILAREDLVAALLGLMVDLRGWQPTFVDKFENIDDAIGRARPAAVIIDCDHPECTEELIEAIRRAVAIPILYSPFRMQTEVRAAAERYGVRSFTLPTDPDTFGKMFEPD
ncbi:MAG: hypothetical protein M3Z54_11300 [Gemmatimonadota bacterium]|nr:hypothetical protein [Gemmatimonadota bacterium]